MAYRVEMTNCAKEFIVKNVTHEATFARFEWAAEVLSAFPAMGPAYEPEYAAARPPFPCRYLPLSDTPFTLYYLKDDEREAVAIFDIEWSAGDPHKRFTAI